MAKFSDWDLHHQTMREVLEIIGTSGNYVLKGGTSLMMYYGLPRTSEDLDLDALRPAYLIEDSAFFDPLIAYCNANNFTYSIAKKTESVSRLMIHYNPYSSADVLKVEASYRNVGYHKPGITYVQQQDGVYVCTIAELALSKSSTYHQRSKIRDLYDNAFIIIKYYDELPISVQQTLYKTFEFETLTSFQCRFEESEPDDLVNLDELLDLIVIMGEKLNLDFNENNAYTNDVYIWIQDHLDLYDSDPEAFFFECASNFEVEYDIAVSWFNKYEEENGF